MVVAAVAVGGIYPAVVQRFQVQPNQQDAESEFIKRNIDATLDAYDLQDVEKTDYDAEVTAEAGALRADADTTASIRLLDPQIVSPSFKQLEQIRAFYDFPDSLSVDRYEVNGESRDTVIAVRELSLEGLDAQQRNWTNDTTVYTHGFGVVAAYGNTTAGRGAPDFWEGGIPSSGDMGEYEPRIYFSPKAPLVLDRRRPRGYRPVGAGLPRRRLRGCGEQYVPDAGRLRRPVDRQPAEQAALRAEVRLGADPVLRPRDERLADPLRARPARPRAEGRPVPHARRPGVPRGRRRPGQVDRRRLHDVGPVPVLGAEVARRRHDGLADRVLRDHPGAPAEDRELHPQLGEGHGRRLRRLGHAVRVGRRGPDPQGVGLGVPVDARADVVHQGQPDEPPALPRGPVQGAAQPARPLPRDRRRPVLLGERLLGQPERPDQQRRGPAAAVLPDAADARPGRSQLLADVVVHPDRHQRAQRA